MKENLIKKLDNNDFKAFEIQGHTELEFVNAQDFDEAQYGFRFNPKENKEIDDWKKMVDENAYVIGRVCNLGDPIIADAGDENFPIYCMMHDDWTSLEKVSNSFDEFIENLKALDKMINLEHQDKNSVLEFVKKLDSKNGSFFYEDICYYVLNDDILCHGEQNIK